MTRTRRFQLAPLMLVLPFMACAGCSMFSRHDKLAELAPPPNTPSFIVEYRPEGGKPQRRRLPLQGEIYVSDVLEKVNESGDVGKTFVSIERTLENGKTVRMGVDQSGKGAIAPQFDYAIHEGDRVVLTENTSTAIDKMLGMLPSL